MDKFSAMQAFVRVVEAGTFSKAAESMAMPKPTITRLIQTLEKELDTKLLNRTTRKVTVTADGAAYYERASQLLGEMDELEASMSRAKASPRGRLKVDIPASLGLAVIIPALPDFYARYPDIQLELGVTDRPIDILAENVDCVIRGGDLVDQSMVARRLGEFYLMTCASPAYLARHGTPRHPRELAESHRMIRYMSPRNGKLYPMVLHKDGETIEVEGYHLLAVNDSNAGVTAGLAGLGVLHTVTFLVQHHISNGALEPLFPGWCSEAKPIYLVYPPNRHLSNKVRVFVDWIVELFARHELIQQICTLPRTKPEATPSAPEQAKMEQAKITEAIKRQAAAAAAPPVRRSVAA